MPLPPQPGLHGVDPEAIGMSELQPFQIIPGYVEGGDRMRPMAITQSKNKLPGFRRPSVVLRI